MVAKSFQSLRQIGEPYTKNGRQYVKVEKKSGGEREVRWYTEAEYAKMYPDEKINITPQMPKLYDFFAPLGYIYVVKDWSNPKVVEYLENHRLPFRQHGYLGWFLAGYEKIPEDIPSEIELLKVDWELGKDRSKYLKYKEKQGLMSFYENW